MVFEYGVKLGKISATGELDRSTKAVWYCLLDPCFSRQKFYSLGHTSTSNVTQHLETVHGIISKKTQKLRENQTNNRRRNESAFKLIQFNPERYYYLATAIHVAVNAVPFQQVCKDSFQRLFVLSQNFPKIYPKKLKDYLFDVYFYLRNIVSSKFVDMKRKLSMPFVHLTADLYTSKTLQAKFFGVTCFVCRLP